MKIHVRVHYDFLGLEVLRQLQLINSNVFLKKNAFNIKFNIKFHDVGVIYIGRTHYIITGVSG